MNLVVNKTKRLNGTVIIPGSKSQTIRGLLIATLAKGTSVLRNSLIAEDTITAISACRKLGAKITFRGASIKISSRGVPLKTEAGFINTGNSGITTRFILPILGLRKNDDQSIILDCGSQMRARPILPLIQALKDLGMNFLTLENSGCLPQKISGKLAGGKTSVDGITSQYASALLLSAPCAKGETIIEVNNLHERPYVEMTLDWLKDQRIKVRHIRKNNTDIYKIKGAQKYHGFNKDIPGDFSSASYFLAAGAILPGSITVKGLDLKDPQGDKELINILKKMGAKIKIEKGDIKLFGGAPLQGMKIDANKIPDLVPTLAVLGSRARGRTEITNVVQARLKETDRLKSMREGLIKMGAKIKEKKDGLIIYQSELKGAKVNGYNDHRTIMALSLAGMLAKGKTTISTAEGVNKTFPQYIRLMKIVGGKLMTSV